MPDGPWYYNVKTGALVQEGEAPSKDRLGPFATRAEAAKAFDTIRKGEARKSADDTAWNNGDN
ncbi:MAG: SPOR domain-containing protein [Geodermatophilaceae bacterium]|nr:SPOR domain-containing protein [Geodermatophilaceae bacterium]